MLPAGQRESYCFHREGGISPHVPVLCTGRKAYISVAERLTYAIWKCYWNDPVNGTEAPLDIDSDPVNCCPVVGAWF
jgi:hypothetical protein